MGYWPNTSNSDYCWNTIWSYLTLHSEWENNKTQQQDKRFVILLSNLM